MLGVTARVANLRARTVEQANGIAGAYGFVGTLTGVVSLVLFAQMMGSEYTQGTLKVSLSREPRRLRLLAGKTVALGLFVGLAILIAAAAHVGVAALVAVGRGIDTSAWWSGEGLWAISSAALRTWGAAAVWGALGLVLSIILRSPASAIGIGVGYTIVGETLLGLALDEDKKWLPGNTLSAFAAGGSADMELWLAGLLIAGYAVAFLVTSSMVFKRRDVV